MCIYIYISFYIMLYYTGTTQRSQGWARGAGRQRLGSSASRAACHPSISFCIFCFFV